MNDSIINKLKEEHRQVEGLLDQIQAAHEPTQKSGLFLDLKQALLPHMAGEEQTLYARLRQEVHLPMAEKLAEQAEDEHHQMRVLLQQLDALEIDSEEWEECFQELKSTLQRHVEEEETHLLPEAREDFSREELSRIADDFDQVKAQTSV